MALSPGDRLGPYEVLAIVGEGGMGQVYRARDTRLGRQVAIKILPENLAADPDRTARFEREARTLASLNHPHIAQIYGTEQSGETHALVMELVEGEDLAQRIARGPIPWRCPRVRRLAPPKRRPDPPSPSIAPRSPAPRACSSGRAAGRTRRSVGCASRTASGW